jgi:hypothetical protein
MKRSIAESPQGWLGFFFGDSNGRRLAVAFAVAIALHEIAVAFIPTFNEQAPPENVSHVRLLLILKPTPKPSPPIVRTHVIAPQQVKPRIMNPGASAQRAEIKHAGSAYHAPKTQYHSKPIWDIAVGGHGTGAGKNGTYGSLGHGSKGPGEGTSGNGAGGGPVANEPCGYVDFSDPHGSQYDKRTGGFFVDIRLHVHFPDGHVETQILDYPFYYPSEAANPFSDQNANNPDMANILFQFPPANKLLSEPALVQYVIQHTTPTGHTLLNDCPNATDAPTPPP